MLKLKQYQENALQRLREFFTLAATSSPKRAFIELTEEPYHPVPELPDMPCVCLRVPTGGGKTLMACHAVGIAAKALVETENAVVLWLVPSDQIRSQTLEALRNRRHPYRQALERSVGGPVEIMDLQAAVQTPRAPLDASTCVIVSTLAAFRVENTDNRKVYETSGSLMSHFDALDETQRASLQEEDGTVAFSLANVLRLRHPIVIVDEAHNARTLLSFETLARFEPACAIEFTATPVRDLRTAQGNLASSVLCHVSASELKAADMVKLPIRLETGGDWKAVVADALRKREELEELAKQEQQATGEYLRPILLLQAQPKSARHETLTVETLEAALQAEFAVPGDWIRVATGERREIAGEDLLSPDCPARIIITVQALKEGWDCSFAYVLCSVAELSAATAVEQILGRIMRLPGAKKKTQPALTEAFAFVASPRMAQTAINMAAGSIVSALEHNGFNHLEAQQALRPAQHGLPLTGLFREAETPSQLGARFSVPMLAIREGNQLELVEPETFLPEEWQLSGCDPRLSEAEFKLDPDGDAAVIDAGDTGMKWQWLGRVRRDLRLLDLEKGWPQERLANRLDRELHSGGRNPDIAQHDSSLFLDRLVGHLVIERGIALPDLVRFRFRLRDAAERKIADHRVEARRAGQQRLLTTDQVLVTPELCFSFPPDSYPCKPYDGPATFRHHYYPLVGEMNDEETSCALALDSLDLVRHWVRNVERQPRFSFWLPTPTDRFYPDFVAELQDGRHAVIEYKGEHLRTADDAEEKDRIGKLWADRSDDRCLFILATKENLSGLPSLVLRG